MNGSLSLKITPKTKHNFSRALLITQISIYLFIILHSILWYIFGIHFLTKLCPFLFAQQVGSLEFNWAIVFWVLVFVSVLFFGRAFCAWGCMFGAYQDFVSRIATKTKSKPLAGKYRPWIIGIIGFIFVGARVIGGNQDNWPSLLWHVVIVVFVGLAVWMLVEKKAFKQNSFVLPKYVWLGHYLGGIVMAWISINVLQSGIQFAFDKYGVLYDENWVFNAFTLIFIAAGTVLAGRRIFCKYMCPIGMVFRFINAIPFPKKFRIRATGEKCVQCNKCSRVCLAGLDPMKEINTNGYVKDPNCINCLECISNCPRNAIDYMTGSQKTKEISEK